MTFAHLHSLMKKWYCMSQLMKYYYLPIRSQIKCMHLIIAVCMYRLVMVSIDLSETAHFAHWKSETTFFLTNFFPNKKIFFSDFVLDWILCRTEFCLGLNTAVVFRIQSFNSICDTFSSRIHCTSREYPPGYISDRSQISTSQLNE